MDIRIEVTETVEYAHTLTVHDDSLENRQADDEDVLTEAEEMIIDIDREDIDELAVPERYVTVSRIND